MSKESTILPRTPTKPRRCLPREMDPAAEHLVALLQHESSHYSHHMSQEGSGAHQQVCEDWRRKIGEWFFDVVDHFGFDREVVLVAFSYIDRAIAMTARAKEERQLGLKEFQLISTAAFYLAIKLHGDLGCDVEFHNAVKLPIKSFVDLTRNLFSIESIEKAELALLCKLRWHVNPPTPIRFISAMLEFLPSTSCPTLKRDKIFESARFLAELSACVSLVAAHYSSSAIAYACILCAFESRVAPTLSYDTQVEFLKNLDTATSLKPTHSRVQRLVPILKMMRPSMFAKPEAGYIYMHCLEEPQDGNVKMSRGSPVSVTADLIDRPMYDMDANDPAFRCLWR